MQINLVAVMSARNVCFGSITDISRTSIYVRFTPNSGRKWVTEFMSESDPKRTFMTLRWPALRTRKNPAYETTKMICIKDPYRDLSEL